METVLLAPESRRLVAVPGWRAPVEEPGRHGVPEPKIMAQSDVKIREMGNGCIFNNES